MSFRERGRIHTSTESPLAVKAFGIAHDAKIFQDHQRRGVSLLEDVQNLFGIPCSSSSGGSASGAAHGGDIQNDLTQHKASERRHLPVRTTPGDVLQESSPTSGGLSQSGGGRQIARPRMRLSTSPAESVKRRTCRTASGANSAG